MATYVQADRPMAVTTPLGKDALLLVGFSGQEAISQLFAFQLELLAENKTDVAFDKLLGQGVVVQLVLPQGKKRTFSGIVSRLSQGERDDIFTAYRLEMVPPCWLLTRRFQSRIFQQMTVPDILKKVLAGLDVAYEIQGTFYPRDYCVQYRESDWDFASRLMEEEGIYYFFKHEGGACKLVLATTPTSHPDLPGGSKLIYEKVLGGGRPEDRVTEWEKVQELRSGKVTLWDHCFELPHKHLEADKLIQETATVGKVTHKLKVGGNENLEIYDYPGAYAQRFDGVDKGGGDKPADLQKIFEDNKRTVALRMQEEALQGLVVQGAGNCRHLVSGHKFTLERHWNADGPYVLVSVHHTAKASGTYRSGGDEPFHYSNRFTCIPLSLPYRPRRVTAKPMVGGSQTAVVVGPAGEEIFTDKYGRVKVQFPWDRQGKYDANSSCWVRVSQNYAGKGWGVMCIPRIGQEVVVDFLEGDPDQPLITGRVYNADQMPPYKLPKDKVVSGLKSNSSPGGGGYNEFIMNDTKGKELIRVHGQFDMDSTIEHDLREHVLNDRSRDVTNNEKVKVGVNQDLTVGSNQTYSIGSNQTGTVGADKKISVGANHTETIGSSMNISVGSCLSETVLVNYSETVGGAMEVTVGGLMALSVGAAMTHSVGAAYLLDVGAIMKESVGASKTVKIGANLTETVGGKHTEKVSAAYSLKAASILLEADNSITLKTGGASIEMKSGGDITIKGTNITVNGTNIKLNGSAKILETAPNISSEASAKNLVKGAMVNAEADGIATIKGSLVKIN
jgi:type VI secretion system secreted protein VgrG